jgi:chromosomal replication initiator protein
MSDARELARAWRGIVAHLQLEVNPAGFHVWFDGTRPLHVTEHELLVEARSSFVADWLNDRLAHVVRGVAAKFLEADVAVRFVPAGSTATTACAAVPDAQSGALVGEVNRRLTLDTYLQAAGNYLALHCVRAVLSPDEPAVTPVAVWGLPGVGKTHLLHAVANAALSLGWEVACLSGEAFANRYAGAVRRKEVETFQTSIRRVRLLIVDDLQYLAGKPGTQDELTHTIDAVINSGGYVAVAAETHPLELNLPARLTTRLSQGVVACVEPLALPDRRAFIQETARRRHAPLPTWCVDRIAQVPAPSVRVLLGAVNGAIMLDRCGLLETGRLDSELARIVLNDAMPGQRDAETILAEVARRYQTTPEALAGGSRSRTDAEARAVAAALLQQSGRSLSEIGKVFDRDRTTMGPLASRGRKILETRPDLRAQIAG